MPEVGTRAPEELSKVKAVLVTTRHPDDIKLRQRAHVRRASADGLCIPPGFVAEFQTINTDFIALTMMGTALIKAVFYDPPRLPPGGEEYLGKE
jgi:hypothetical protein